MSSILDAHNSQMYFYHLTPLPMSPHGKSKKYKYLGVIIDKNLIFRDHIPTLSQKLRKLPYLFKYPRHVAETGALKMMYQALTQSILTFCITKWRGAAKTILLELDRAQRPLLKLCFLNLNYN